MTHEVEVWGPPPWSDAFRFRELPNIEIHALVGRSSGRGVALWINHPAGNGCRTPCIASGSSLSYLFVTLTSILQIAGHAACQIPSSLEVK